MRIANRVATAFPPSKAMAFAVLVLAAPLIAPPARALSPRWVWLPPVPAASGPTVYDSQRHRLLALIGGWVWELDLSGPLVWRDLDIGPAPAIDPQAMVYDPIGDRLIAYEDGKEGHFPAIAPKLWEADLGVAGPQWVEMATSGLPWSTRTPQWSTTPRADASCSSAAGATRPATRT